MPELCIVGVYRSTAAGKPPLLASTRPATISAFPSQNLGTRERTQETVLDTFVGQLLRLPGRQKRCRIPQPLNVSTTQLCFLGLRFRVERLTGFASGDQLLSTSQPSTGQLLGSGSSSPSLNVLTTQPFSCMSVFVGFSSLCRSDLDRPSPSRVRTKTIKGKDNQYYEN